MTRGDNDQSFQIQKSKKNYETLAEQTQTSKTLEAG